tara:strand:+ start:68 stop:628 length:561 start_codon:yes stop_codon:yes gene_type:complete
MGKTLNAKDVITVYDDFLSDDEFKQIENIIMNQHFPWYHSSFVATNDDSDMRHWYNIHMFYNENVPVSSHYKDIYEIFMPKIDEKYGTSTTLTRCIKSLIRIKANFYPWTEKLIEHNPHYDYDWSHCGAIFAMNTCDGYTRFGNDDDSQIVESKKNRMIFFDPSIYHNSTTTTNAPARVNINFNFL